MATTRKRYSGEFKAEVALAAIRGERTINELAAEYGVHPAQIMQWKKIAQEELPGIFTQRWNGKEEEELKAALYQQIGQLKVELDWVKKRLDWPVEQKRELIEPGHPELSIRRQGELRGLDRSSLYYEPVGERAENLDLMRLSDEQYTATPFYGIRRMTAWLRNRGYGVNAKRVSRLLRRMGLTAIYPRPKLSQGEEGARRYPYLLRGVRIERANQVWSTDITYIRLRQGFVYLVAVMDWFSRYVLSWSLSITLDVSFCLEALEGALARGRPEIFNSDQGSQFTSGEYTGRLDREQIQISRDGRGRALDKVLVERLWRSVKYEEVYLKDYATVPEAQQGLRRYFGFYNQERLHQALGYRTPAEVYLGG